MHDCGAIVQLLIGGDREFLLRIFYVFIGFGRKKSTNLFLPLDMCIFSFVDVKSMLYMNHLSLKLEDTFG